MYGLLLDMICRALRRKYGNAALERIKTAADISQIEFSTTKIYSESLIGRVRRAAMSVTGASEEEIMELFGSFFVLHLDQYGYDMLLKVLGRNMRDFINGLDNLHEYLRFTYRDLKPPSFFCEEENRRGLTLHYRSRRQGFLHYVIGQIKAVGMRFYGTEVQVEIIDEQNTPEMTHVVMRLHFDNEAYESTATDRELQQLENLHLSSDTFLSVFPFHVVFNRLMVIENVGSGLAAVSGDTVGSKVNQLFSLTRPLLDFTLQNILMYNNNVFELTTKQPLPVTRERNASGDMARRHLSLKGQMMYIAEWQAVIYLATPIMENLDRMFEAGLYINDLSMHDSSRDLVLAATQQSSELKLALDQEKQKSQILEESVLRLDNEMERTDSLLYQMIPRSVADRLRCGQSAASTCQVFDSVTILFSDVVGFTRICSQIAPMKVVSMLNVMYTEFDKLSENYNVYKVETIGDAYMIVSGAPTVTSQHAEQACNMALHMTASMKNLIEPSTGRSMQIRIGVHSGTVVAGVVGHKMPRYCLFGDTVNIASLMENNGQSMRVNISEATKARLEPTMYNIEFHGAVGIKEHLVKMYWLTACCSKHDLNGTADI